jgi:Short C-terminal domain
MGLFKTYKDVKALGDHHGGMPSMRDAYKDIKAVADDRGEREILAGGTATKAVVQGFPTMVPDDRFAMEVPLDVYPPDGGAPYRLNYRFPTTRMKAALSIGMEIPVKVDLADPARIAVQWDAQVGSIAAAGGDMAAVAAGMANAYSGVADAAMRQASAGAGAGAGAGTPAAAGAGVAGTGASAAGDPLEKIAQLAKLRDSGALTEEEFSAKKAQLLSQM